MKKEWRKGCSENNWQILYCSKIKCWPGRICWCTSNMCDDISSLLNTLPQVNVRICRGFTCILTTTNQCNWENDITRISSFFLHTTPLNFSFNLFRYNVLFVWIVRFTFYLHLHKNNKTFFYLFETDKIFSVHTNNYNQNCIKSHSDNIQHLSMR